MYNLADRGVSYRSGKGPILVLNFLEPSSVKSVLAFRKWSNMMVDVARSMTYRLDHFAMLSGGREYRGKDGAEVHASDNFAGQVELFMEHKTR